VRTYGRVALSSDGGLQFSYRPWLIFSRKAVTLPSDNLSVGKGVLFPSLLHSEEVTTRYRRIIIFLPRYRSHEQAIAEHFGIQDIQDSTLTKGFKAVRVWINDILNTGQQKVADFKQT